MNFRLRADDFFASFSKRKKKKKQQELDSDTGAICQKWVTKQRIDPRTGFQLWHCSPQYFTKQHFALSGAIRNWRRQHFMAYKFMLIEYNVGISVPRRDLSRFVLSFRWVLRWVPCALFVSSELQMVISIVLCNAGTRHVDCTEHGIAQRQIIDFLVQWPNGNIASMVLLVGLWVDSMFQTKRVHF